MTRECHPILKPLIAVVKTLGPTLGPDYEIVLHDVSTSDPFIVAMENGDLTERSMDSPLTDFGCYLLDAEEYGDTDFIANYPSLAPDGRRMRSSVTFIRDEQGNTVGFLCINYDISRVTLFRDWAESLLKVTPLVTSKAEPEKFSATSEDLLERMLDEVRQQRGRSLRHLSKAERLEDLRFLDEKGFFRFKGGIEVLCREMGKSRYTIYGNLRQIRGEK